VDLLNAIARTENWTLEYIPVSWTEGLDALRKTPVIFNPTSLYFAARQDTHADLLATIDRRIRLWQQQPESPYFQILARWMQDRNVSDIPQSLFLLLLALAACLTAAVIFNTLLHRKIDNATDSCYLPEHSVPDTPAGVYARMHVRDTGPGIDAETQKRLFEPFFTTKPQGKGTGLGLPTVYGIVRQAKGYIRFRSRTGHGTTFEIGFPLASDSPARI
jgi:hypothetical protein